MQDDELRIEDLGEPGEPQRLLSLTRRLWVAWQGRRGAGRGVVPARVATAGLTVALGLALLGTASDGQSQPGGAITRGANPVPVTASEAVAVTGKAPAAADTGPWQLLTLPSPAGPDLWYSASPSDPATLYACTGQGYDSHVSSSATNTTAQITLAWRSRDSGVHWNSLPLPALPAPWCSIQVAQDAPSRVIVLSGDQLYLSDDGGDSWSAIALPAFPLQGEPGYTLLGYEVLPTAHHLYVQLDYQYEPPATESPTGARSNARQELSAFARSDDLGRSWTFEGQALGRTFFRPSVVSNDDTLIASTLRAGTLGSGSATWLSRDAGATWTQLASLQHAWTANLVTSTIGAANVPVYAMLEEQIPSSLFRLKVQQLRPGGEGGSWTALPPLPVSGASPSRMGLIDLVGETPDGRLLALGVDPAKGVPVDASAVGGSADAIAQAILAPWLWEWNPDEARWQPLIAVPPVPQPPALACAALCWLPGWAYVAGGDHPLGMYLLLRSWKTAAPVVDRIFLPASGAQP